MTEKSDKSDRAFRTISEVAGQLDLPQHVLRFWETKFRQVSPLKRGGGRRYYRPQDVELLRRIKSLLHTEGYTIKGVQRMLGQGGVKKLPPVAEVISMSTTAQPEGPTGPSFEVKNTHNTLDTSKDKQGDMPGFDLAPVVRELEEIREHLNRGLEKIDQS